MAIVAVYSFHSAPRNCHTEYFLHNLFQSRPRDASAAVIIVVDKVVDTIVPLVDSLVLLMCGVNEIRPGIKRVP